MPTQVQTSLPANLTVAQAKQMLIVANTRYDTLMRQYRLPPTNPNTPAKIQLLSQIQGAAGLVHALKLFIEVSGG